MEADSSQRGQAPNQQAQVAAGTARRPKEHVFIGECLLPRLGPTPPHSETFPPCSCFTELALLQAGGCAGSATEALPASISKDSGVFLCLMLALTFLWTVLQAVS